MLGKQIEKIRTKKGLSRYQLARLADVSDPTIKAVEEGKGVQLTVFRKVAKSVGYEVVLKKIKLK
jgi:transcriptional regulator with XRE-family HTH domain